MAEPADMVIPLMTFAVEVRYLIYERASERDGGSDLLLKNWFEKVEAASRTDNDDDEDDEDDEADEDAADGEEEDNDGDEDEEDAHDGGAAQDVTTTTAITSNTTATTTATTAATATATTTSAPTRRPSKYRHTLGILRLSACPPPVPLLQTSKTIYREALDWYYKSVTLHIAATKAFRHTTFYELILSELGSAPFSPIEQIQKVEVTLAWDSKWLREREDDGVNPVSVDNDGNPLPFVIGGIFESQLRVRAEKTAKMLAHMPALREVKIHWYDSEWTSDTLNLKMDVLEPLEALRDARPVQVEVREHFGETGPVATERVAEFEELQRCWMQFL